MNEFTVAQAFSFVSLKFCGNWAIFLIVLPATPNLAENFNNHWQIVFLTKTTIDGWKILLKLMRMGKAFHFASLLRKKECSIYRLLFVLTLTLVGCMGKSIVVEEEEIEISCSYEML